MSRSSNRVAALLLVLLALFGCEAKAAPPSVAQPAAPQPQAAPTNGPEPPRADKPQAPRDAPASAAKYADCIGALLQRDLFKLDNATAQARFGQFVTLSQKNRIVLAGGGPREELELAFTGDTVLSAELALFADGEADAIRLHGELAQLLKSKLGKSKERHDQDTSVPTMVWKNGRAIQVVLSAQSSERRQPGQWEVTVTFEAPGGP